MVAAMEAVTEVVMGVVTAGHHGGGHHGGGHGHAHFGGHHGGGHLRPFGALPFVRRSAHAFVSRGMRSICAELRMRLRALTAHSGALHDPGARARITAGAALAGWHFGRSGGGWWQHGNGGYGWVGPLFWPFGYYDIYDYALWGRRAGGPFWSYGYGDIYAGLFSPYDYDDLAGYLPSRRGHRAAKAPRPTGWRNCAAKPAAMSPACRST